MECRCHRTGPGSDEIPRRRRRTGLARDDQPDLDRLDTRMFADRPGVGGEQDDLLPLARIPEGEVAMPNRADRLPEFPPGNELPASLELGPMVWRSADVGVTVTGFLVYSTGVTFSLVALSK